jgi:hypothetical protein
LRWLVTLSSFLACIMPIPTLPAPRGPYGVARRSIEIPEAGQTYGFFASLYYPTTSGVGSAPYLSLGHKTAFALGGYLKMPFFVMSHVLLFKPPVFGPASALAAIGKKMPVVVFSHGLSATPDISITVIQHLVSHGGLRNPVAAELIWRRLCCGGARARRRERCLLAPHRQRQDRRSATPRRDC